MTTYGSLLEIVSNLLFWYEVEIAFSALPDFLEEMMEKEGPQKRLPQSLGFGGTNLMMEMR